MEAEMGEEGWELRNHDVSVDYITLNCVFSNKEKDSIGWYSK